MGYVFISYSSKERETADAMRNLLNKYAIKTWMAPNDIPAGSKYARVIGKALKNCDCLILMLSNASQNSTWVAKEVERAINYRKTIIPVQMEALTLNDEFEMYISTDQIIAIRRVDEQAEEVRRLLGTVCSIMHIPLPPVLQPLAPQAPAALTVGSVIDGKYTLLRQISSGEGCEVYLSVNKISGKTWAVKIYPKDKGLAPEKLMEEIALMKTLRASGIPDIVDIVDTQQHLMVVMDYVEGETLSEVLKNWGIQSEETVLGWAKQLCDVLGYLHSRTPAVVHNDIKPANIMLTPGGDLILMSFGMAGRVKYQAPDLGSMHYTAPETFAGKSADHRTDIYALGATMYALVTGSDPSVPPHVIYPLRKVNPDLSLGMEYIINKCMERDPADRYQNAAELMYDLESIPKLNRKLSGGLLKRLFKGRKS